MVWARTRAILHEQLLPGISASLALVSVFTREPEQGPHKQQPLLGAPLGLASLKAGNTLEIHTTPKKKETSPELLPH